MSSISQAIVLAAGEGQRLRPFTSYKPKVMIKVGNKPVLVHVLEALRGAGIRDVILVVGYRKQRILEYLGDGSKLGLKIRYVEQKHQLGTAHALKQAEPLAKEEFLVVSGDNIIESSTLIPALESGPNVVLYKQHSDVRKYGALILEQGKIKRIVEKPSQPISNLISIGIYTFEHGIFSKMGDSLDITQVLQNLIDSGEEFKPIQSPGIWFDIAYPWDIISANSLALRNLAPIKSGKISRDVVISGNVHIGEGCIIHPHTYIQGPVIMGDRCKIGPHACILPSTSLGDQVEIGAFSLIQNSVIMDRVRIGSHSILKDSVVDSDTIIGDGFKSISGKAQVEIEGEFLEAESGVFIGEQVEISSSVITQPCTILGNRSKISPLKLLRGKIPDGSLVM